MSGGEEVDEWTSFGRARWGPARMRSSEHAIEAEIGDVVLTLDVRDRRTVAEVKAQQQRDRLADGVPVLIDGVCAATVTQTSDSPSGILRRATYDVVGDDRLGGAGVRVTARVLPSLLTLRDDTGWLVTSGRAREAWNVMVRDYLLVVDHDLFAPRVSKRARSEHVALWLALKNHLQR